MKKIIQYPGRFCTVLLLCLLTGCVLTPRSDRSSAVYDLQLTIPQQPQDHFVTAAFRNSSPAKTRMLYRKSSNEMIQDEYNCWIQPPERMLQRLFNQAFPLKSKLAYSQLGELRIDITEFEFDLKKSEALLSLNYVCKHDEQRFAGTVTVREKAPELSAAGFAAAMNKAAGKAMEKIRQDIQIVK